MEQIMFPCCFSTMRNEVEDNYFALMRKLVNWKYREACAHLLKTELSK
jgi:hypothetical protein